MLGGEVQPASHVSQSPGRQVEEKTTHRDPQRGHFKRPSSIEMGKAPASTIKASAPLLRVSLGDSPFRL
jgi:hypothetical protein